MSYCLRLAAFLLAFGVGGLASPQSGQADLLAEADRLAAAGELQAAEELYLEAVAIGEDASGHPGPALGGLGAVYLKMRRYAEGEKVLRRAVAAFDRAKASDTEQALAIRSDWIAALLGEQRFKTARKELGNLLKIAGFYREDPARGWVYALYAQVEEGLGNPDMALWYHYWAIEKITVARSGNHADLQPILDAAHALILQLLKDNAPDSRLLSDVDFLDPASWIEGRYRDAELGARLAQRARMVRERRFGPNSPTTIRNSCTLGAALVRLGRYQQAQTELDAALLTAETHPDLDEAAQLPIHAELAELHAAAGNADLAVSALRSTATVHRDAFSRSSTHMRKVLREVADKAESFGFVEAASEFRGERDRYPPGPWEADGADVTEAQGGQTLRRTLPKYPPAARSRGLETTVFLLVLVDEDGNLGPLMVHEGGGYGFEKSAKAGVAKWHVKPDTFRDRPFASVRRIQVNFHLQ